MFSELKMQHVKGADAATSYAATVEHSCKLSEFK